MFAKCILAGLIAFAIGSGAQAADLAAVKRVILKEPAYEGKPGYCLFVFGKEATTRVWVVFDGKNLYVDRNGNGDLTDADEKVSGQNFTIDQIVAGEGTVQYQVRVFSRGDRTFQVNSTGKQRQYVGIGRMDRPSWGDTAESAPIIHLGGPLSLERYGPIRTMPRNGNGRGLSLQLLLGTPGVGKGTFASYNETCSQNLGALRADLVFSQAGKPGATIEQRVELLHDG